MQRKFHFFSISSLLFLQLFTSCGGREIHIETSLEDEAREKPQQHSAHSLDQKVESLSSSFSRLQTRIEEMDARLAVLSDKLEAAQLALDNLTGNKKLKTEYLQNSTQEALEHDENITNQLSKHTPKSSASAPHQDEAITAFTKAMELFKAGKYTDAELAFGLFTELHPEHILAGSAQFYAGESYFMMGEYKLALNEYNKVVSSFGSSPRVASAMVRISHCQELIGDKQEAAKALQLAQNIFQGNPSLDWKAPTKLKVSPIEPETKEAARTHAESDH